MSTLLIQNGRLIDPAHQVDRIGDLLIVDGRIAESAQHSGPVDRVINASGCIVSPGLIDCHVSFGEPGFDEDETIATGAAAALAGGFTTVACLPATSPVIDSRASAEFIVRQGERANQCRVLPLGAVTKNLDGLELAEIGQLIDGGAVGFSDGKRAIANAEIMRRALQYTGMWDKPILHHAQVPELVQGGIMHEGFQSTVIGLQGMPAAAEEIMVRRDIALAETTGGRVHLMCLSSLRSVDEVRRAIARGLRVTADVSPHHLLLTDECLSSYDTNYKVDPPVRTKEHRDALVEGLKDGTIAIIASDHLPVADEKKNLEIDRSPFGIIGLETLLPLCVEALIQPGYLTWPQLLSKLTAGPAELLGLPAGTLRPGSPADITIIDPTATWRIQSSKFRSRSRNTPFDGRPAQGQVRYTIVGGEVKYTEASLVEAH
ncbi:dihydroorotase [Planctomicrobium piriforme]|uniref:Dihydroorotase n=1 Tax=Planctomicrobium piriforme TaxID=1576369 RepID=A0A1I3FVZ6_9PLAN|nr:dihydroorotase [Planctomicrobium piriforme]SFI15396.1 dihydroorotase [Planctomicrobium piriforme]